MDPGAHVVVFGGFSVGLEARRAGFEVRDSLLVLSAKPQVAWLLRAPLVERTVAAQVLATGTGALWIEGSRIDSFAPKQAAAGGLGGYQGHDGAEYEPGTGRRYTDEGRWPANVLLLHDPACTSECVSRCVVPTLDEQSGELRAGWFSGTSKRGMGFMGNDSDADGSAPSRTIVGSGGASRFYRQVGNEAELDAWLRSLLEGPPTLPPFAP